MRRASLLARLGIAWHVFEATVAIAAGLAAGSVALIGFGADSVVESLAGNELGSSATVSEGRQNLLCAYLSAALLVGLGANAVLGWWWADPVTALAIAAVALHEGREAWRGEACDCC